MSNEQYESEERRSPLSKFEQGATAALALGAGAAFLYRNGFNKLLSDGSISKAGKILGSLRDDISNNALKDIDDAKIAFEKYISGKDSLWKSVVDKDIVLRRDNPNSIINVFTRRGEILRNKKTVLTPLYNSKEIIKPLTSKYSNSFGRNSEETQNTIRTFVKDAVNNLDNYVSHIEDSTEGYLLDSEKISEHFKNTDISLEEQAEMMEDIISKLKERDEGKLKTFVDNHENIVEEMADKLSGLEDLKKKFGTNDDFGKKVLGEAIDRQASLKDLIKDEHASKILNKNTVMSTYVDGNTSTAEVDIIEDIKEFLNKHHGEGYEDLLVDKSLRINKEGELYSTAAFADAMKAFQNEFSNTIPGKILKTRDMMYVKNNPVFQVLKQGEFDSILANIEGQNKTVANSTYVRIIDKTYKVTENGLDHIEELDGTYLISGQHGSIPRMLKSITGDIDRVESKGKINKALGLYTSPQASFLGDFRASINKFDDEKWERNIVRKLFNFNNNEILTHKNIINNLQESPESEAFIKDYYKQIERLNRFFNNNTKELSRNVVNKMVKEVTSPGLRTSLELLKLNDNKLIDELLIRYSRNKDSFKNPDLIALVNSYMRDPSVKDSISIISSKLPLSGARGLTYTEKLRKEVAKEAFLKHMENNNNNLMSVVNVIEKAGLNKKEKNETLELLNWSVLQKKSGVYNTRSKSPGLLKGSNTLIENIEETQKLFTGEPIDKVNTDTKFYSQFRDTLKHMTVKYNSTFQSGFEREKDNIIKGNTASDWIHMRKAISPLDVLKDLNNKEKLKAFGKQFYAGRDSVNNITTATMFPYFFLHRLSEPLEKVGLNLSPVDTGSVVDMAAAMMTKRVLPVIGAATALSYLDYRTKAYTGTSLKGGAASSIANFDLGARKIIDSLGMSDHLKSSRQSNVMAQYLFGDDYNDHEERKDFYESGYTPVRKGRWWSFGSDAEFRGSKIDYFQPNFVIRANSDWYDNSMYGSTDEKWKHSWIPTPRHPLSTLRALADPYWLEKKHYSDRPYPVTGKLFGEGTPWSGPLNATIGQIIKPQKKMHRAELGRDFVDVRDIIASENERVKIKNSNSNLIQISNNGAAPVSFTPYSELSGEREEYSLNVQGGYSEEYNAKSIGDAGMAYVDLQSIINENVVKGSKTKGSSQNLSKFKLSFMSRLETGSTAERDIASLVSQIIPESVGFRAKAQIASINNSIKVRGKQPVGEIRPDAIFKVKASSSINILSNKEAIADLRNINTGSDSLSDMMYSAQELAGIYGFIFEEIGGKKKKYKIESATNMDSFSRRFWGESIGGWGGEIMEIGRRFFPHEDHSVEGINPIRNTMPTWMPKRFQHGDPYAILPKGEMRLPGTGYESIYKLHSDQFGRYGAYDRMKILADIAPYSSEYKMWRDIATKTVSDPKLKAQMKKIRERVIDQSKTHDFYNYKFIGRDLKSQYATINKVISSNTFTVVGDNRVYKFAGAKIGRDVLKEHLIPGMAVTLRTDANKYNRENLDGSISALVYTKGYNLNKKLIEEGVAKQDKSDTTAPGVRVRLSDNQVSVGKITEFLAHLDVPYLHNKFMRVESPLESYKRNHFYGKEYGSWSHPIDTIIKPALNKSWSYGPLMQMASLATWQLALKAEKADIGRTSKLLINGAWALSNRGAFIGGTIGTSIRGRISDYTRHGANIGSAVALTGYAVTRLNNPIESAINFGIIGLKTASFFKKKGKEGALIGAGIGLVLSSIKNPNFDKDRMFGVWTPGEVKRKWEIEEYFDRMKYIKYMGLYEKAARKARFKEGVDIKRVLTKIDKNQKTKEKIQRELLEKKEGLSNIYQEGDGRRERLENEIDKKLRALSYPTAILKAGEYTKAAIAYKQAAESTIYGLRANATWSQILRALPKEDRDYVLEFAKEKDPKKRKEIYKYISPYERKVLDVLWGKEPKKQVSNSKFFAKRNLPGPLWKGWRPTTDLDNVEAKVIKNEGLQLSDFGMYESQLEKPETISAPTIDMKQQSNMLEIKKNLITTLNGAGLVGVDVSIEPSTKSGIQVVADFIKVKNYELQNKINSSMGRIF